MHKRFIILMPSDIGDGYTSTRDPNVLAKALTRASDRLPILIDTHAWPIRGYEIVHLVDGEMFLDDGTTLTKQMTFVPDEFALTGWS